MTPGTRLRSWASRVYSRRTMERLIDPVIADLQCEHDQASRSGRPWARRRMLFNGYLAFWKVLALHIPIVWTGRTIRAFGGSEQAAVARALGAAAVSIVALSALFTAPPLQGLPRHDAHWVWLAVLLVPQSLPLCLPFSLLVGVLWGFRGRTVTNRMRDAILVIGLAGSLASFGTFKWLIPAADHAFRVTLASRHVVTHLEERTPASLRARALVMSRHGRLKPAGDLFLSYHARWAVVGAALTFALFGLGVTALRAGGGATAGIGTLACLVYITYGIELSVVPPALFSNEPVALVLAWLPNLWLILTSILFLSIRREARLDI
jgi:hypothetical protein